jgi:hypothetical protein
VSERKWRVEGRRFDVAIADRAGFGQARLLLAGVERVGR